MQYQVVYKLYTSPFIRMANSTDDLTTLAKLFPLDAVLIEDLPTYYRSGLSIGKFLLDELPARF